MELAVSLGAADTVKTLIAQNPDLVSSFAENGWTSLHRAAWFGQAEIARILIEAKADPSAGNQWGWTPLHEACLRGYFDVAKLLVDSRADIDAKIMAEGDHENWTPLHLAVWKNRDRIATMLIEHKADINSVNNYGQIALHYSCAQHRPSIIRLLLAAGSEINPLDYRNSTPFDLAPPRTKKLLRLQFAEVDWQTGGGGGNNNNNNNNNNNHNNNNGNPSESNKENEEHRDKTQQRQSNYGSSLEKLLANPHSNSEQNDENRENLGNENYGDDGDDDSDDDDDDSDLQGPSL